MIGGLEELVLEWEGTMAGTDGRVVSRLDEG